ncbi:hypothetical protein J2S19_000273 [Metabacillus malikii]|uniref:Uncharacterized protein n=1 Tax=Metabacillus malikii TaxID=1504265 RepID=A0ABT9ZBP2_9BACI|nr:hypothetical protein [Metabacillus malikii]
MGVKSQLISFVFYTIHTSGVIIAIVSSFNREEL